MAFDSEKAFAYLDSAEEALEGLQGWLDNTFNSMSVYGQEGVDAVCAWAGEWVSYKIVQIECNVVKGLHGAWKGATEQFQIAGPIYNLLTGGVTADLGALASAVLTLAMPWLKPTLAAIQTLALVPVKLVSITGKIADLAAYQPPIQQPGISFSNFKVSPKLISMGDIISGQFTPPTPPEPFTTYMKASISTTKEKLAKVKEEAANSASASNA